MVLFSPPPILRVLPWNGQLCASVKRDYKIQIWIWIFYECLLYNRTLDLIQEFKNIKQNYYKSRGHFNSIPCRKLPVSKMILCYCLGLTLYFFFFILLDHWVIYSLMANVIWQNIPGVSLKRTETPWHQASQWRGGHGCSKRLSVHCYWELALSRTWES